jgi:hypothetical protein
VVEVVVEVAVLVDAPGTAKVIAMAMIDTPMKPVR